MTCFLVLSVCPFLCGFLSVLSVSFHILKTWPPNSNKFVRTWLEVTLCSCWTYQGCFPAVHTVQSGGERTRRRQLTNDIILLFSSKISDKNVQNQVVTSDEHKHTRLQKKQQQPKNKHLVILPPSDLDSQSTAFRPWHWCHLPIQVIIALGAACVLARLLPDWLWKHSWFLWRHTSVTETPHPPAYITDLMATCFSAVNNLASFFSLPLHSLLASISQSVILPAPTGPYNSHRWQQSNYILGARITS